MSLQKSLRHESKKLRDSARGKECQIRIPGICNYNNETVVLCHINGGGAGTKHSDLFGAYGCDLCHSAVDGRIRTQYNKDEIDLMLLQGMARTQQIMLDEGLIKI